MVYSFWSLLCFLNICYVLCQVQQAVFHPLLYGAGFELIFFPSEILYKKLLIVLLLLDASVHLVNMHLLCARNCTMLGMLHSSEIDRQYPACHEADQTPVRHSNRDVKEAVDRLDFRT